MLRAANYKTNHECLSGGKSFLLNSSDSCGGRKWSVLAEYCMREWPHTHTQVRHLARAPETRRSVLGYMDRACQCQTDQLSDDHCVSRYPLLGCSQVINCDGVDSNSIL